MRQWRVPRMRPGLDSRTRRQIWFEFRVCSLFCSESLFSGYSGFHTPQKPAFRNFKSILERMGISKRVLVNSSVLRGKQIAYLHTFIFYKLRNMGHCSNLMSGRLDVGQDLILHI